MPNNTPELQKLYEIQQQVNQLEERHDLTLIERFKALQQEFEKSASTLDLKLFNQKRNEIISDVQKDLEKDLEPLQAKVEELDLSKVTQLIAAANSPRARDLPEPDLNLNQSAQAGVQRSTFKDLPILDKMDRAPNKPRTPQSDITDQNLNQKQANEFLHQFKNVPRLKIRLSPAPRPEAKPRLVAEPSFRPSGPRPY